MFSHVPHFTLCSRFEHPLYLGWVQDSNQHNLWYLYGLSPYCWPPCLSPLLYPSKSFDPEVSVFVSLPIQSVPQCAPGTVFTVTHDALPSWMSFMLPPVLEIAPIPFPTLTPAQPKRALLALATPDIFLVLPPKTPNLLIFNNATGL